MRCMDRRKLWGYLEELGVNGKILKFVRSLYQGSSCQVKIGSVVSEEFGLGIGLHQGCVLSPLLFSLYINGLGTSLCEEKCRIECGGTKCQVFCLRMTLP